MSNQLSKLLVLFISLTLRTVTAAPHPFDSPREPMLDTRLPDPSPLYPTDKNITVVAIWDELYGERDVAYFTTSRGLAIIDGDVVYGSEARLLERRLRPPANSLKERAFSTGQPWPNAEVLYKYDATSATSGIVSAVNDAIARWHVQSPYLRFTRLHDGSVPINGVLTISSNDGGCHANIGYAANEPLFMNLEQPGCDADVATHEFGHVLGKLLNAPILRVGC